ncbi:MAG: hypothetical protein DWI23_07785 [Planctomycetota bacterium]|nr:MAG: hypothetical protein DWI23_07785 [Planctomycetota bacterium]
MLPERHVGHRLLSRWHQSRPLELAVDVVADRRHPGGGLAVERVSGCLGSFERLNHSLGGLCDPLIDLPEPYGVPPLNPTFLDHKQHPPSGAAFPYFRTN